MTIEHSAIRGLVQEIIDHPERHEWTLQGLGMLRTYVGPSHRLHVWDPDHAVPDVSTMHTHPWDMRSYIVAGEVQQFRYLRRRVGYAHGDPWLEQAITCGAGGGVCGEPRLVTLRRQDAEIYLPGDTYEQTYDEIHSTTPAPGTVTLIERTVPPDGDPDVAYVFYKADAGWVSAEPRKALLWEVQDILRKVEL